MMIELEIDAATKSTKCEYSWASPETCISFDVPKVDYRETSLCENYLALS